MAKARSVHRCTECGADTPRWLGRCPTCDAWGSLVEEAVAPVAPAGPVRRVPAGDDGPTSIVAVDVATADPVPTGVAELDRVLGGGLVPGSVTLLAGEPGAGKSTLLLQALGHLAASGHRCLLVTAEESCAQVRVRAERVGAMHPELHVVAETSLPHVLAHVDGLADGGGDTPGPALAFLAIDSIQTVHDPESPGAPGSVAQVRDCAYRLVQEAKARALPVILVGHVTKEGTLAGPRVLEHVVDTVLSFDGDRGAALRVLHAPKHRFGGTHEVGLFEMTERGLVDLPDASARFLVDRLADTPGSVVAAVLEGTRPLLVEVQALVVSTEGSPRRVPSGLDAGRLAMVAAVLERFASVKLGSSEIYASVVGGLRITETGLDLGLALAVAGVAGNRGIVPGTVVVGELGLGGEVRTVPQTERRLAEAARHGFTRALVPWSTAPVAGIELVPVRTVGEALATGLARPAPRDAAGAYAASARRD